jgi:uncharacterized protein (TIGR02246 family)
MRALPLLLVAACATTRSPDDQVRAAIGEAWLDHFSAVKRKDAAGVGRLYADDVVYIVPGECEVRGRKAIDEMEAKGLASAEIHDVVHTTEALDARGDVAYEIGTVVGPVQPHGQPAKVVRFRYMAIWRRQAGGDWRIQYMVGQPERE